MNTEKMSMSTVGVVSRPSGGTRRTIACTYALDVRISSRWSPYSWVFIGQTPYQTRKRLREQGQVRGEICNIKSKIHCAHEILPKSAEDQSWAGLRPLLTALAKVAVDIPIATIKRQHQHEHTVIAAAHHTHHSNAKFLTSTSRAPLL